MAANDFVMTIDSDDEAVPVKTTKVKDVVEDAQLNPDFVFDLSGDPYSDLLGESLQLQDYVKKGSKSVRTAHFHTSDRVLMFATGAHFRG